MMMVITKYNKLTMALELVKFIATVTIVLHWILYSAISRWFYLLVRTQ